MAEEPATESPILLFKYGGNAMTDEHLQAKVLSAMCSPVRTGYRVVIVHGGGPFIRDALREARIESEFIDGHRVTTPAALPYVEMALKGRVNGTLVRLINALGFKAVGLSGKDGKMVIATKRSHYREVDGRREEVDLGRVGDVSLVDPTLLSLLLDQGFIPVVTCLASNAAGVDYNINADLFAGHLAGALHADQFIVLTDVDGLLRDKADSRSLIGAVTLAEARELEKQQIIQGGMIPKMESCAVAIQLGAKSAHIINGTRPGQIEALLSHQETGTRITAGT